MISSHLICMATRPSLIRRIFFQLCVGAAVLPLFLGLALAVLLAIGHATTLQPYVTLSLAVILLLICLASSWALTRWFARRHYRLSTRQLLLAVSGYAILFAAIRYSVQPVWSTERSLGELAEVDCYVAPYGLRRESHSGLAQLLGRDPFDRVTILTLRENHALPALIERRARFPHLAHIDFMGIAPLEFQSAGELNRFSQLRGVAIYNCALAPGAFEQLAEWWRLESIFLNGTVGITGPEMAHLEALPNLRDLSLLNLSVSDAALEPVGRMQHLTLVRVPVTDAALKKLENLGQLEWLRISGTTITSASVSFLQEKLPDCWISWEQESLPTVTQIRHLEVHERNQPLRTILSPSEIAAVKEAFEETIKSGSGWGRKSLDSPAFLVRFAGPTRALCQIQIDPEWFQHGTGLRRQLSKAEYERLAELLRSKDTRNDDTNEEDNPGL
jgi:hypothetical protein